METVNTRPALGQTSAGVVRPALLGNELLSKGQRLASFRKFVGIQKNCEASPHKWSERIRKTETVNQAN